MDAYDPSIQSVCQKNEKKSVMGTAPTLTVIEKAYGDGASIIWLCKQLAEFNEFVGKKEKMDDWQIEQLARGILLNFGFLKASEIMLFLYQYKMGQWGPIFGVIDPQDFLVVLKTKFIPWRAMIVRKAEDEAKWEERDNRSKTALKPDEIRKLKARIQSINDNVNVTKK